MVSTQLIGSPKSVIHLGFMKRRPTRAQMIAELFETFMAISI